MNQPAAAPTTSAQAAPTHSSAAAVAASTASQPPAPPAPPVPPAPTVTTASNISLGTGETDVAKENKRLKAQIAKLEEKVNASATTEERLNGLLAQIQSEREAHAAQVADYQATVRAATLAAYTATAQSANPDILPELIGGASEAEIDASVDRARAMQVAYEQRLQASGWVRPAAPGAQPAAPPTQAAPEASQQTAPQGPPAAHAMHQSPYYTPAVPQGGFPTPAPVPRQPAAAAPEVRLADVTTEEAVRQGKYSGAMRENLLAQLRHTRPEGAFTMGNAPRFFNQMPSREEPGGVHQPAGLETPQPRQHTQMVQTAPAHPQAPPPGSTDYTNQAVAALNRLHDGTSAALGDPTVRTLATNRSKFQGDPTVVQGPSFEDRFANSAPIRPN